MEKIDWDKAPEGTLWLGKAGLFGRLVWVGVDWYEYVIGGSRHTFGHFGHFCVYSMREIEMVSAAPREKNPLDWNGDGLPPVGVVCEYQRNDVSYKQSWVAVTPVYIGKSVIVMTHCASGNEFSEAIKFCVFRPIRTPEQIAAEEREAAIEEMLDVVNTNYPNFRFTRQMAIMFFELGFRRP